jgi:hypothetical protein
MKFLVTLGCVLFLTLGIHSAVASQNCLISYTLYFDEELEQICGYTEFTVMYYLDSTFDEPQRTYTFSRYKDSVREEVEFPIYNETYKKLKRIQRKIYNHRYMGGHSFSHVPEEIIEDSVRDGWYIHLISPKRNCGKGRKIPYYSINNVYGKNKMFGSIRFKIEQRRMARVNELILELMEMNKMLELKE